MARQTAEQKAAAKAAREEAKRVAEQQAMEKQGNLTNALRALLAEARNIQDGIKAADKVVKEGKATISGKLLALAKQADNVQAFIAACDMAETEYKQASKGKHNGRAATIPTCWTQAKSNIKAGWNLGIDPKEYDTESEFRKETNEKRKAAKAEAAENEGNAVSITVPKDFKVLVQQFVRAYQVNPDGTNAVATDALAKLDQLFAAAMPKGEPVQMDQQKAA